MVQGSANPFFLNITGIWDNEYEETLGLTKTIYSSRLLLHYISKYFYWLSKRYINWANHFIIFNQILIALKVEFNELEAFNGDSSSVIVEEDFFDISRLQPGRNYSIAIKAVSNGMESVGSRKYQATRKF